MAFRATSKLLAKASAAAAAPSKRVVLVDGVRIPFSLSQTTYDEQRAYDLSRTALHGLLTQTAVDPAAIDYVLWGTVIQEVKTSNIARETALGAGIPKHVPAHTVTMACISSSQAIVTGAEKILAGNADIIVAGGVETFSDVPIRHPRSMRKRLLRAPKAMKGGAAGVLKLMKGMSMKDFVPEAPAIANFHTGEVMGHSSDRLAAKFGVTRQEQDELAYRSHKNAAKAHAEGKYVGEILPFNGSTTENGIKPETTIEKLNSLKPAFVKPHGTHTAGNSSFLTDGAACCLIMSEEKALELGYKPKAVIHTWNFSAVDPFEELLLGPAYAIDKVLRSAGLTVKDIDAWEIHEAFAGQVLANLKALASEEFGKKVLGRDGAVGEVPVEKLNSWGGSLALGHPFGATGARLITTSANRLIKDGGKYAILAACADSGLAHACLVEKYEN